MEETRKTEVSENLAPAIVKKLNMSHVNIYETRSGLQLTWEQDVDSGRSVPDINTAKEVVTDADARIKVANQIRMNCLGKDGRKARGQAKRKAKAEEKSRASNTD